MNWLLYDFDGLYYAVLSSFPFDSVVVCKMQTELTGCSELVFSVLKEYSGGILFKETIEALLRKEDGLCEQNQLNCLKFIKPYLSHSYTNTPFIGYPQYPLYCQLSRIFAVWMRRGKSALSDAKASLNLLQEVQNINKKEEACHLVDLKLELLSESWHVFTTLEKQRVMQEILETLQLRGILDLLGMRQTVGSVDVFPPPESLLWKSFREKHKPNTNLSCGARALSKHCHRDSTSSWWGASTGSESDKNEHADRILKKILDDAAWINIHMLPHDVKVLEVRSQLGYGARWSSDGKLFRGFLEPQMDDGHAAGWKH